MVGADKRRLGLPSPSHDPSAEAEPARADIGDPCFAPGVVQALLRPFAVEGADRAAEERAGLAPAVADHGARDRKAGAHVELPERAPRPPRHTELEPGDRPAGANDTRELLQ